MFFFILKPTIAPDNCSKELKHQTSLRMMATQIALHKLRGCEFDYLSSGHSHEDIDGHFSLTAAYLDRFPELWCIDDFQNCLTEFLSNKSVRVHEPKREVLVFDQFHDWTRGQLILVPSWFLLNKLGILHDDDQAPILIWLLPSYHTKKQFVVIPLGHSIWIIMHLNGSHPMPRKGHYSHHLSNAHLKGIGGPGAPHLFRLERVRDAGVICAVHLTSLIINLFPSRAPLPVCQDYLLRSWTPSSGAGGGWSSVHLMWSWGRD